MSSRQPDDHPHHNLDWLRSYAKLVAEYPEATRAAEIQALRREAIPELYKIESEYEKRS